VVEQDEKTPCAVVITSDAQEWEETAGTEARGAACFGWEKKDRIRFNLDQPEGGKKSKEKQ